MFVIWLLGNGCLERKVEVGRVGVHFEGVETEKGEGRREATDDVKAKGMAASGMCMETQAAVDEARSGVTGKLLTLSEVFTRRGRGRGRWELSRGQCI